MDPEELSLEETRTEEGCIMKDFLDYVVRSLVDKPDDVDIKAVDGEKATVYELRLAKSDIGKVIGKNGRTIQAIRTLLTGASAKQGRRAVLEIIEDEIYVPPQPTHQSHVSHA
jgi:uncharacterized protein